MDECELMFEWDIIDGRYHFKNKWIELFGFRETSRMLMSDLECGEFDLEPKQYDPKAYYGCELKNELGWVIDGTFISETHFEAVAFSPDLAQRIWPEQE